MESADMLRPQDLKAGAGLCSLVQLDQAGITRAALADDALLLGPARVWQYRIAESCEDLPLGSPRLRRHPLGCGRLGQGCIHLQRLVQLHRSARAIARFEVGRGEVVPASRVRLLRYRGFEVLRRHGVKPLTVVDPADSPFSALFGENVYEISWLGASSAIFCHYNRRPDRIGSAPPEVSDPGGPGELAVGAGQYAASAGPTLLRIGEC